MKMPTIIKRIPPTDTLGLCDTDDKVLYINMKQTDIQILITLLHEALHFIHPEFTEEKIETDAVFLGKMVWKMGYRLKTKKNAKTARKTKQTSVPGK